MDPSVVSFDSRRNSAFDVFRGWLYRSGAPSHRPAARLSRFEPVCALPRAQRLLERIGSADAGLQREVVIRLHALERRPPALVDPQHEMRNLINRESELEPQPVLDHRRLAFTHFEK